jgi:hypothetical protein
MKFEYTAAFSNFDQLVMQEIAAPGIQGVIRGIGSCLNLRRATQLAPKESSHQLARPRISQTRFSSHLGGCPGEQQA